MTRVFHIISHFDLGGAERIAASIAKSENPDIEYHVVEIMRGHSAYTADLISELRQAGVGCHRSLMPDYRFHFLAERTAAILFPIRFILIWLRYHPDVIHAHTETPDMCLWAFFRVFPWLEKRCRIVRTIHNTRLWTGLKRFGLRVERFYQRNNANVAISQSVRASYHDEYKALPPVVYNGVEEAVQIPFDGILPGKRNILFAGRFDEQKGISHLIYIIRSLRDDAAYHFHVIGSGILKSEVETQLGGLPNVTIYPPVFGISRYLSSFDYMLMPSEFEGLGLMSVEASLAGLPVICSDCKGLDETLPSSWPLVSPGNSHSAYDRIFRKVLPAADRAALAATARSFVAERFSVSAMRRAYEKIYTAG